MEASRVGQPGHRTKHGRWGQAARWRRASRAATLLIVAVAAIAGCGGSSSSEDTGSSTSATSADGGKPFKILFVGHGNPGSDPGLQTVVNGFKAAIETYGLEGDFRGLQATTFNAADMAKLLDQALATKPDGVIVSNAAPDALNGRIEALVDAGIPVVIADQGQGQAKATGALTAVVNDDEDTARVAAEKLRELGVKKPILLTVAPGVPLADIRNKGFKAVFPEGQVIELPIPISNLGNPTAVQKALEATLTRNPDADAVFSVGVIFNPPMLAARAKLGARADSMKWASIDLGELVVDALRKKQMAFAMDGQLYLHGYTPVEMLYFHLKYGLNPPEADTFVGPSVVTPAEVGKLNKAIEDGVRGA